MKNKDDIKKKTMWNYD